MKTRDTEMDDRQLETLFEQARRYPLLSAEQEQGIDHMKWSAVAQVRRAMLGEPVARRMLRDVAGAMLECPPRIDDFGQRDLYFVLRRELSVFQTRGRPREQLQAFLAALEPNHDDGALLELAKSLPWSGSLWTGIANLLCRLAGRKRPCVVADAIGAWASHWPTPPVSSPLPPARCLEELEGALERFDDARDTLTLHNLRLVYTIAGRQAGRGVPLADLIQEGTLGLIRAAEKFEHAKGYRFSTYCFNWISQAVRRAVGDSGALIRYPTHVREQVNRLYATREQLIQAHGRAPTDVELAHSSGIALEKTRSLRQLRNLSSSLDAPVFDDGETTLEEQLPAAPAFESHRDAELRSLQRRLLEEIEGLNEQEQRIVVARWGLHEGPPLSRAELADLLGVSREWVRQLEVTALDKLSHNRTVQALFEDYSGTDSAA